MTAASRTVRLVINYVGALTFLAALTLCIMAIKDPTEQIITGVIGISSAGMGYLAGVLSKTHTDVVPMPPPPAVTTPGPSTTGSS